MGFGQRALLLLLSKKWTKKSSPLQGRGKNWTRGTTLVHRRLATSTFVSALNTPAFNGAYRLGLLTQWMFDLQLRGASSTLGGAGFSALPTLCSRPRRLLVLFNVFHC